MKIGILGAGAIGMAFAKQVTKAGYDVLISNSRGPASLKEVINCRSQAKKGRSTMKNYEHH
uniref:NADP oxidoreductase coenzyme F420-dependent n=1 Tax=Sphingobacterium sp. (strain 21) TaxID=743722 RepID=F4CC91_SPHS2